MLEWCKKEKNSSFLLGAAAALVGAYVLRSDVTRKLCVKTIAGGMKLQSDAQRLLENVKEDAQDLYYEAQQLDKDEE